MNRRLMFVHAHPDDESSKGAATAARYVDEGAEVVLVTLTGGEAGEVLNPSAAAVAPEEMGATRARELAAAVAAIGFTRTYGLGYRDSGYHEDPDDVPAGSFARTPLDEPAARLAAIVRRERPQVVVTYPEDGGYPHPDHIMCHAVTMRALELAEDPGADLSALAGEDAGQQPGADAAPWRVPKVYASGVFPPGRVIALHEAMLERTGASPYTEWLEKRADRFEGPDPDALIECGDWFERRDAALLAHVTQIDPDGFWFAVPRDLEREVFPYEGFHVLRSDVGSPRPEHEGDSSRPEHEGDSSRPEDDLFAGVEEVQAATPGGGSSVAR